MSRRSTENRTTRRSLSRLLAGVLAAALAATGLLALGTGTAAASEGSMFGQVNSARSAKGLPRYSYNSHLASVAQQQANRMASKGKLYHNPNLGGDVGNFRWVGENVGYGPSFASIQRAFMDSAPHRKNILDDDFTQIGIGSKKDGKGRWWVAQVFRQPSGGSSSSDTPKKKQTAKKSSSSSDDSRPARKRPRASKPATAPKPAASARPTAKPKPAAKRPAARPSAAPTLAQRVSQAQAAGAVTGADPVVDALAFAATMNAVGG